MKVTAIVVTYNREKLFRECVHALLGQDYKNIDILLVDNCSKDGTVEYIKSLWQGEYAGRISGKRIFPLGRRHRVYPEAVKILCTGMADGKEQGFA